MSSMQALGSRTASSRVPAARPALGGRAAAPRPAVARASLPLAPRAPPSASPSSLRAPRALSAASLSSRRAPAPALRRKASPSPLVVRAGEEGVDGEVVGSSSSLPLVEEEEVIVAVVEEERVPAPLSGARLVPLLASVSIGLAVQFLVPRPSGVSAQGWSLLAIFLSTIAGLVLEPLPVGAWAFVAATVAVAARVLTFAQTFEAFTNDVIWLIVVSFFFARGFEKTGLGSRVAMLFVRAFGRSTLGLAYGLAAAEALVAPAMPSTTARAGGIFMPIIDSLARASGSLPRDSSRRRLGAFLTQAQFQGSVNTSAAFLTAAAQSLLCVKLASQMGVEVPAAWTTWFKAAAVPALVGGALTPLVLYAVFPPEVTATPDAPAEAAEALRAMGPMSRGERVMLAVMAGAVALWVAGDALGVSAVTTAMLGLSALLLSGVLTWRDCISHAGAWDTLFWFAILVGMSGQLNRLGVVAHFAGAVGGALEAARLAWPASLALLSGAYYLLHYLFASQTAHVGALFAAFLAMMLAAGVPPLLATLVLGFLSNLFGSITHFGSGQAAVYYGSGYLSLQEVFAHGALITLLNALVWGVIGPVWWKTIGLF